MKQSSCICITHPSRIGLLERSILNFVAVAENVDTELVIVTASDGYFDQIDAFVRTKLPEYQRKMIRVYHCPFRQTGEALAHAVAWAYGEFIVCWDDDNMSSGGRLKWQIDRTEPGFPTLLTRSLYYFHESGEVFIADYAQPGGKPAERCAVSSLIFHRDDYRPVDASRKTWAEAYLDGRLAGRQYTLLQNDEPGMFLVGVNGDNFRGEEVHQRLGRGLPATWKRDQLTAQKATILNELATYPFPEGMVTVSGKDGMAFEASQLTAWPNTLHSPLPPDELEHRLPTRERAKLLHDARSKPSADKA